MRRIFALCLVVLLFAVVERTDGKNFTRCGLINELLRNGFQRHRVGNWLCLIESESGKDTSKQIDKANGNKGLGLFQIQSREWCKFGSAGGKCNMKCEAFIDDDISDDSICAKKIERLMGFRGWEGWKRSCCGRSYPTHAAKVCLGSLLYHEYVGWLTTIVKCVLQCVT